MTEDLVGLLDSAISRYPPALAVSRDKVLRSEEMSRSQFMEALAGFLRFYLNGQCNSPFFLARAIKEELGYKSAGRYYWIVGMGAGNSPNVSWVSADFFVYQSPATDFDVKGIPARKAFWS